MKYLGRFVQRSGISEPIAYHDAHWTRRHAPLLDHMGAVIDHVEAHSRGGANEIDNLATACNKCNANKSNIGGAQYGNQRPRRSIKGKFGEPEHWDGLSTLFLILIEGDRSTATASELDWLKYLGPKSTKVAVE